MLKLFHVMLEQCSANNPGLHPGHFQLGTFLFCWVTISVVICVLPCFILFLSDLNSFSHLACLLWLFPVPQMMLQNMRLSSVSGFSLLSVFPFSFWYTQFWSFWNNLLVLYCSILWSYLFILVALACIFCFSFSRTTSNLFLLTLYLCSVTLYFSFFLITPRFFLSQMWINFHISCIDCLTLLFHQGSFTTFPFLWFGLRPTFFPTKMIHALINLLASVISSYLISVRKAFTFIVQFLSKFPSTFLILFTIGLFGAAHGCGGWQKGPPSLKSVTQILQRWNLAQLYLT